MLKKTLLSGTSVAVLMMTAQPVLAADIDITTTGATAYTGSPAVSTVSFTADGTLNVASGASLNPGTGISVTGNNVGTVNFAGNSNIYYLVGGASNALKAVNINSGSVDLDSNGYHVGTTTIANGATLTVCKTNGDSLTNTSCQTVNGNVVNNGSIVGAFALGSGNSLTNNGSVTGNVLLGSGGMLNLAGTVTGNVSGQDSSAGVAIVGDSAMNGTIGTESVWIPVLFTGDHTLNMGSGKSIWGAVTAATDGQGTITYSGSTNIYVDMGQSGSGLKAVNLNGGTVNLDDINYYVGQTTVASGATLATHGDDFQDIHGNLTLNGTLDLTNTPVTNLKTGPNAAAGNFTTTSGSVIRTAISGDGNTSGAGNTSNITMLTTTGTATLGNGTTVTPVVNGITISNGARYILIDGTGTASVGTVNATNSALVSWSVLRGDDASLNQSAGDVYLVASKRDLTSVVTSTQAKGAATALTSIASSSDAGVQNLVNAISSLSTQSEVDQAVKQLAPSTSVAAATTSGSTAATTTNINVIGNRANDVRLAQSGGMTGVAAGDVPLGLGVWVQGLGFSGRQNERQGQDGYDAATGGLAFGGDFKAADALRIGAAFSYAHTNVNAKGDSSGSGADIDSYQGTLYANYTGSPWYVDTTLVYGRHKYDSSRAIGFTGFSGVAKGDYDGNQYTAQVAGGYPLVIANTLITPNASLAYSLLKQDAYTETGAPGANLSVDEQSNTSIRSGLGVKAAKSFSDGNTRLIPEARATWFHEFRANAPDQTARFSAGGSFFTTTGAKPAQDSAVLGVGLTIATADQVSVSANYDAELKDRYVGHNGMLQVRLDF